MGNIYFTDNDAATSWKTSGYSYTFPRWKIWLFKIKAWCGFGSWVTGFDHDGKGGGSEVRGFFDRHGCFHVTEIRDQHKD